VAGGESLAGVEKVAAGVREGGAERWDPGGPDLRRILRDACAKEVGE